MVITVLTAVSYAILASNIILFTKKNFHKANDVDMFLIIKFILRQILINLKDVFDIKSYTSPYIPLEQQRVLC